MQKRLSVLVLVAALAFVTGCGSAALARAGKDLENSQAAYERCRQQYPGDPSRCEALKRAYEADVETYQQASRAATPVTTGFIEFGGRGLGK